MSVFIVRNLRLMLDRSVRQRKFTPNITAIFSTSEAVNEALCVLATATNSLPQITVKRSTSRVKQLLFPWGCWMWW